MYKIEFVYDPENPDKIHSVCVCHEDIAVKIEVRDWDEYLISEICERIISFYNKMVGE